mgnify:CR=1 FL=1
MTRLKKLFNTKSSKVLNVYCTAGYPALDSTLPIIAALEKNGADLVELGMPYSDPLADGPIIQNASTISLEKGTNISKFFNIVKKIRKETETDSKYRDSLENLRAQINVIDDQLIDMLGKRMKVADQIGQLKKEKNASVNCTIVFF